MALTEPSLYGTVDKVADSIRILRQFAPEEGYWVGFSGGKDSIVVKRLCHLAGVGCEFVYCVTTIDPPELVHYIREHHKDVIWDRPKRPFLAEMVERGFPLRQRRWCCADYKERGGAGRFVVTGVRWAESARRSQRRFVETCNRDSSKRYLHPILNWSDSDVWDFIRINNLPYCSLYDQGFKRIGCMMCPLASGEQRMKEALRWPRWRDAFERAFVRMYARKKEKGSKALGRWANGREMFNYWLTLDDKSAKPDSCVLFE